MLTQQQYNILQRRIRYLEIKIELLNNYNAVLDTFEGIATSGSVQKQADSAYRRSADITMIVKDSSLLPKSNSKIWFNRKLKIFIGLRDWDDSIVWFNQGVFLIHHADVTHSQEGVLLSLDANDLMSNIDGTLNGYLSHEVKIVPESTPVAEALRSTLSQLGLVSVDDIKINDIDAMVPYELSFQPNATVYEIAKTLIDLYMGLEMFYDENGILIVRKIRDRIYDPILWDFSQDGMDLAVDYQNNFDFTNVRNSIFIWGRKKDTGETVKWTYKNKYSRDSIAQRNSIVDMEKGDICYVKGDGISYIWDGSWKPLDFIVSAELNTQSIGEKKIAYTDEKIATEDQAMLRAEYELRNRGHFSESVSFSCVPIFALSVNSKIKIKDIKSGIDADYLVKSVSIPLEIDGEMTVQAEKIYY